MLFLNIVNELYLHHACTDIKIHLFLLFLLSLPQCHYFGVCRLRGKQKAYHGIFFHRVNCEGYKLARVYLTTNFVERSNIKWVIDCPFKALNRNNAQTQRFRMLSSPPSPSDFLRNPCNIVCLNNVERPEDEKLM